MPVHRRGGRAGRPAQRTTAEGRSSGLPGAPALQVPRLFLEPGRTRPLRATSSTGSPSQRTALDSTGAPARPRIRSWGRGWPGSRRGREKPPKAEDACREPPPQVRGEASRRPGRPARVAPGLRAEGGGGPHRCSPEAGAAAVPQLLRRMLFRVTGARSRARRQPGGAKSGARGRWSWWAGALLLRGEGVGERPPPLLWPRPTRTARCRWWIQ